MRPVVSLLLSVMSLILVATHATALPPSQVDRDPVGEWPLRPTPGVAAGFDPPTTPWGAGHRGVDLIGTPEQQVRAALAGNVSFVGMIAGRGVVVVDHGDTRTTYEPVAPGVTRGQPVAAGDALGRLALPGSHCFPRSCLHWGWIRGETYLDPLRLVGAGPVRLLPLAGLPTRAAPATPYAAWRPLTYLGAWAASWW